MERVGSGRARMATSRRLAPCTKRSVRRHRWHSAEPPWRGCHKECHGAGALRHGTVSYTHLTLPTICSV
eukprot:1929356-Prymnesium_polylepis.1